jgi:protease I
MNTMASPRNNYAGGRTIEERTMPENTQPIAIVAAAGFIEQSLTNTQKALIAANIPSHVITPEGALVQGWHENAWGHHFMADEKLADVISADYRGLILLDGPNSADSLTESAHAKRLVKAFVEGGKPVLAIDDAIRLLIAAEVAAGRRIAAPQALRSDLTRDGAEPVDSEALVTDGALVTATAEASGPARLEAFLGLLANDSVSQAA